MARVCINSVADVCRTAWGKVSPSRTGPNVNSYEGKGLLKMSSREAEDHDDAKGVTQRSPGLPRRKRGYPGTEVREPLQPGMGCGTAPFSDGMQLQRKCSIAQPFQG